MRCLRIFTAPTALSVAIFCAVGTARAQSQTQPRTGQPATANPSSGEPTTSGQATDQPASGVVIEHPTSVTIEQPAKIVTPPSAAGAIPVSPGALTVEQRDEFVQDTSA